MAILLVQPSHKKDKFITFATPLFFPYGSHKCHRTSQSKVAIN